MLRCRLFFCFLLYLPLFANAETIPPRIGSELTGDFFDLVSLDTEGLASGLIKLDLAPAKGVEDLCKIERVKPGKSVSYSVNSAGGTYWLILSAATDKPKRMIEVAVAGQARTFEVPRKGWQTFSDIVFPVNLPPGISNVRVTFRNGHVNLQHLELVEPATDPLTVWTLPARLEAEQFVNSFDNTGENVGDVVCNTGAVDSLLTSDLDGVCDVAWTTAGEWTEYTVLSPTAADYELTLRVASAKAKRKIRVEIDGVDRSGDLVVPNLGWETYSDVKVSLSLDKGQHRIRVIYVTGLTNLNYLNFSLVPCTEGSAPAGCPADNDGDGDRITDDRDLCPLEAGLVELRGCAPLFNDFDSDGVVDAEDLCPYSTPGESPPDGCKPIDAVDSDNDGMNNDVDLCEMVEGYVGAGCPPFLDTDHDGIRDELDLCPNDYGMKVQNGCWDGAVSLNIDADGDGVGNAHDQCSSTAENATVGPNGCAIQNELEDRDRDGVSNDQDLCPHSHPSHGHTGHLIDSQGCTGIQAYRRLDDDNDGVPNGIDLCPATPSIMDADPSNSLTMFGCRIGELDEDRDGIVEALDSCPTEPGHRMFRGCPNVFEQIADGDGDYVLLNVDDCPYTPFIAEVNLKGCAFIDWGDLDGDGVINGRDLCAASPPGLLVDHEGCNDSDHLDFDGDGIMNGVDLCPRFAGLVRQNGCGFDPLDADADDVKDPFDHCPYTAGGDERGCSGGNIEDADGDGALDVWYDDECPNTPITQAAGSFNKWEDIGIFPSGCSLQQYSAMDDQDADGVGSMFDLCFDTLAGIPVDKHGCPLQPNADSDSDMVPDINDLCPDSHKGVPLTEDGCEIISTPRVTQSLHHNLTLANPQLEILTQQVNIEGGPLAPASQPLIWELGEFAWSDYVPVEVDGEHLRLEILSPPLRGRDFRIPLRLRVLDTEVVSNWFELVIGVNPAPSASLIVTDPVILAASTINLRDTLALLSGVPAQANSGMELFQQFWDAHSSVSQLGLPFTCDPLTNGYPYNCEEEQLGGFDQEYRLNAIVNRLDTNSDWQNCGEHRLIFVHSTDVSGHYLNFGARLPNPTPGDMRGCRNVIEFWRELPNLSKSAQAQSLRQFFFEGLLGVIRPAIAPEHFTGNASLYSTRHTEIDSYYKALKLESYCNPTCRYWWRAVALPDNPFGLLFNPDSTLVGEPYAEVALDFQQWFPQHLEGLFTNDPIAMKNNVAERFNTGQSQYGDYLEQFGAQFESDFGMRLGAAVQGKQNADGSPLLIENILARATVTSCVGCHGSFTSSSQIGAMERADGTLLRQWPSSNGLSHIRASGELSPALRDVFLPGRQVLFNAICEELDSLTD